ncbi:hypothetical protein VTK73DRAFT_2252 [Phialemonium thermophilum]|uniref:Uncharacterized protein n=1 Tax=Phialemonium thermophilum TaxID=223376 RepID=A0ABR3X530_9PEZI
MADENKAVVTQQEYGRPKGGKFRRHCARWWWVHLIIFICIAVLVVCLVIFVGVPHIAQQRINKATLEVQSIVVTHTQSENFTMSIGSTIHADDSVHAVIDPFVGEMYLEDLEPHTPFAEVNFPQTSSKSHQIVNVTQQFVPIKNMEAFTTFNTWLLLNETLRVTVKGKTHVKVSGIGKKFSVDFKKTITMPGIQDFKGTTVPESEISIMPDDNGDNFKGITTIPNRSIVTFEIGNVSFHNYLLGEEIGTVYIDNMILRPGVNNYSMHANISQAPVLEAIAQKPYCQTGIIPFQLRGKTVFNHGQPLSYFADALASANQTVEIDIGTDLKAALNYTLSCS